MNPKNQIIQEYDFKAEVLPIVLLGILLNVVGRQIAETANFTNVFIDMTGTALTAFVLGPWWAAAVGVTTTTINGGFFENYFPFAVVNIAGALVWGYGARMANLNGRLFLAVDKNPRKILYWLLFFSVLGGVVGGLTSTLTKLILFPPMGRALIYGEIFINGHETMKGIFGEAHPELLTLLTVDLGRDILDKLFVVPAAILIAHLLKIIPNFVERPESWTLVQRMRTDLISICWFAAMYSVFLFLARVMHPEVIFSGAVTSITWLEVPWLIGLLYAPLFLAIICFIFLSYGPGDPLANHIQAGYQARNYVYRSYARPMDWLDNIKRQRGLLGLSLAVLVWPFRNLLELELNITFGTTVILVAIGILIVIYIFLASQIYERFRDAGSKIEVIHKWQAMDSDGESGARVLHLFRNTFDEFFRFTADSVFSGNNVFFMSGFVVGGGERDGERPLGEQIALVVVVNHSRILSAAVTDEIDEMTAQIRPHLICLITVTPRPEDSKVLDWFKKTHMDGKEVLVADWTDLIEAVAARARRISPDEPLRRARSRVIGLLAGGNGLVPNGADRALALVDRTLPGLRFVISTLAKRDTVFDLGAGMGRHALAALQAGHDVVAAEIKPDVAKKLNENIELLEHDPDRYTVVNDDFLSLTVDKFGVADLVMATGVLQHSRSLDELRQRLGHMADLAGQFGAMIYIEMLFDMRFDDAEPEDGRIKITMAEFESLLSDIYDSPVWRNERVFGPVRMKQDFTSGPRSFVPPAISIESTAVEYLIRRVN